MPVIGVDIKNNAGHCSAGMHWGVRFGWDWAEKETPVKRLLNSFLTLHPPVSPSLILFVVLLFILFFFFSSFKTRHDGRQT